ncbi:hypothetical protein MPC4_250063 [Methylocella tundrae]|uniref:Uncharacterized protein n=1 Tax=Methylocella tundrae TaxID=227605 RepID=A0A8B6M8C7_METTU|nr:hypothetical protein MPC4_250063 [Methylocella tundrae]
MDSDRIAMLVTLATLPVPPESVPINMLIPHVGVEAGRRTARRSYRVVRIVSLAGTLMPRSAGKAS